jgi:glyoxylase-like metal-dependent hydrolase (beta-lactamase superfamily II)
VRVVVVPVTPFEQNCSIVFCERTGDCAVIDPGGDVDRIEAAISEIEGNLRLMLLTHGHLDHAAGAAALSGRHGVPVIGPHRDDAFLLEKLGEQGQRYGLAGAASVVPDRWLEDGDRVTVGELTLEVLHCPGHTPGHLVFFERDAQFAIVGDVLFKGSVGRTDLPRGSYPQLVASIRDKLWPLGEDVTFLPGHGDTSTFGWERKCNPFVADLAFDD